MGKKRKTVRVHILVAIDQSENWEALGSSNFMPEEVRRDLDSTLDVREGQTLAYHWVGADVPLPVIQGAIASTPILPDSAPPVTRIVKVQRSIIGPEPCLALIYDREREHSVECACPEHAAKAMIYARHPHKAFFYATWSNGVWKLTALAPWQGW